MRLNCIELFSARLTSSSIEYARTCNVPASLTCWMIHRTRTMRSLTYFHQTLPWPAIKDCWSSQHAQNCSPICALSNPCPALHLPSSRSEIKTDGQSNSRTWNQTIDKGASTAAKWHTLDTLGVYVLYCYTRVYIKYFRVEYFSFWWYVQGRTVCNRTCAWTEHQGYHRHQCLLSLTSTQFYSSQSTAHQVYTRLRRGVRII